MTLSVVDLFAGVGGFSLGFRQAGFKVIGAVELSKHHAEVYGLNLTDVDVHREDVQTTSAESFMGVADVVIGAPPYEAFLATNKERRANPKDRLYEDPHGMLVLDFVDFIGACRPKAFVLELPPDFADDELMHALAEELNKAGFEQLYVAFLNAAEFGACTDRVSLFISNVPLEPEPPEEGSHPVGALIEELPEGITCHEIENLQPERLTEVEKLDMGDFLEPIQIQGGGEEDVYPNWFRLVPEAVAPPIYAFSRFVHPFEDRLCTVREVARLMGFPDKFVFHGNHHIQYESVGNAVPPPLARAVAMEVGRALTAMEPPATATMPPRRPAPRS